MNFGLRVSNISHKLLTLCNHNFCSMVPWSCACADSGLAEVTKNQRQLATATSDNRINLWFQPQNLAPVALCSCALLP